MKKVLLILSLLLLAAGCTDAQQAGLSAYGNKHKVTLYSGGQPVATWISSGKVHNEENSDGYYFMDEKTGNMITVSGDLVIEMLD